MGKKSMIGSVNNIPIFPDDACLDLELETVHTSWREDTVDQRSLLQLLGHH